MHAHEAHHPEPILAAQLIQQSFDVLLLMLRPVSLNVAQLFFLALELPVCPEVNSSFNGSIPSELDAGSGSVMT